MVLFQLFQKSGKSQSESSEFCQSLKNNLPENLTGRELESIQERLWVTFAMKLKVAVNDEKVKQDIAKYASTHGLAIAVRKFNPKLPSFN